jgi:hypothetical protein
LDFFKKIPILILELGKVVQFETKL